MKIKITYTLLALLMTITALVCESAVSRAQSSPQPLVPTSGTIKVGVMLPLHDLDGDGRRMVEYYRGMLLAINQLKQEGKNIDVHAWNVNIDADPRTTLLQDGASSCNIIFGPLYTKQVNTIANFCKAYNIQMVIPFSINGNDVDTNPMIWQVYESPEDMNSACIKHLTDNFSEFHPVFIDCNDTTSKKGSFTMPLRRSLEAKGIQYSITNLISSDELFAKAFTTQKPNLVILNTGRSPDMRMAMDRLDKLTATRSDLSISLFGYIEWLMYTKYNKERFSKYSTYIPTNFFYNASSAPMQQFIANYHMAYNTEMMNSLPQFAVTGYDHAMYFIGKKHTWLQTPLKFVKTPKGGYRNKTFMLIHYKEDGTMESLQY